MIGLMIALLLNGCAVMRPDPPDVQLAGLEITDLSLTHANFKATLRLYNPNATEIDIEGIEFNLYLNDTKVARGRTAKAFNLPAEDFADASLRLSSSFFNLFQLSRGLQDQTDISFRIAGKVKIGGYGVFGATIPIEADGRIPLKGSLNQLVPGAAIEQPETIFDLPK
jgi:LEA14-like dessication related protein